jgi:hypothetical protein
VSCGRRNFLFLQSHIDSAIGVKNPPMACKIFLKGRKSFPLGKEKSFP